ncbi:MAG: helix-turn-helix transcriptional regulator [Clostridia bacterium]|nr:helix-turn-helix transcriptional regulator [Clostridia bacterium]
MFYSINPERGISDYYCCIRTDDINHSFHVHSHFEFVFVLSGNLTVSVSEHIFTLEENSVAFIMPYEIHSYHTNCKSDVFIIACPPEYIPEYRQILRGKVFEPGYTVFSNAQRIVIEEIAQSEYADDFRKKALIYCALSDFLGHCCLKDVDVFEYDTYRKAIVYISEHYTENINLKKTAFHAGVTPSHLSRVLNSDGKPGFSEIINSMRAYASKQKLEQTSLPISQIAYETGFGSIRNFNRIFKKFFGCNPCDMRR